jgi:hypothetical protein
MGQRGAIWAVAGPLVALKVWVLILILIHMPGDQGFGLIAATHWPVLVIVLLLLAGPGLAWYRLVRVRARRERLRRAEWMVDAANPSPIAAGAQCSLWETVSRLEGDG